MSKSKPRPGKVEGESAPRWVESGSLELEGFAELTFDGVDADLAEEIENRNLLRGMETSLDEEAKNTKVSTRTTWERRLGINEHLGSVRVPYLLHVAMGVAAASFARLVLSVIGRDEVYGNLATVGFFFLGFLPRRLQTLRSDDLRSEATPATNSRFGLRLRSSSGEARGRSEDTFPWRLSNGSRASDASSHGCSTGGRRPCRSPSSSVLRSARASSTGISALASTISSSRRENSTPRIGREARRRKRVAPLPSRTKAIARIRKSVKTPVNESPGRHGKPREGRAQRRRLDSGE
jgi:hypothetical protein